MSIATPNLIYRTVDSNDVNYHLKQMLYVISLFFINSKLQMLDTSVIVHLQTIAYTYEMSR
jgi:hypothetical protein